MWILKHKFIIIIFILISGCVGYSSTGVLGTGVSVAMDPRTIGTQIDDSIMQKTISTKIFSLDKKHFLKVKTKVLDGRIFITGKVDEPEETEDDQTFGEDRDDINLVDE